MGIAASAPAGGCREIFLQARVHHLVVTLNPASPVVESAERVHFSGNQDTAVCVPGSKS